MSNFTNDQARQIVQTVQNILMDYLRAKLNDAEGPYQPVLGQVVTVTPSLEVAGELYKNGTTGLPWVAVLLDRHDSQFHRTSADGQVSTGHRHELYFTLDMSMSDQAAARAGPGRAGAGDRKLCDAVTAIIDLGYADLAAQGLEEDIAIRANPEHQRSPELRNPHTLTVVAYTIDD